MKARMTVMVAIPALTLAFAGYAQEPSACAKAEPGTKGAIEADLITATAKVTAVDAAKRTVTLTSETGQRKTYKLGNDVRNFDQIKVGDTVTATLLESVAVVVRKSSAPPGAGEGGLVAVAPKGDMSSVIMAKTRKISAKIVSVNADARTVTVEGPMGGTPTFKVGPKVNLDALQKGDDVTLRLTDALAIRVEKP
jgi:propanediol utilization protein